MESKNRIIALIDFSAYSQTLVDFACLFSHRLAADVIFVHQIHTRIPTLADRAIHTHLLEEEKKKAREHLRSLVREDFHNGYHMEFSDRHLLATLTLFSSPNYHDYVFTGLKGYGPLKRLFMGSTTIRVINNYDGVSVTFPMRSPAFFPERLVMAVHYKFPVNTPRLEQVMHTLAGRDVSLEFITFLGPDDDGEKASEQMESLRGTFASYAPETKVFRGENAFKSIADYAGGSDKTFLLLQQGPRPLTAGLFRKFMINEMVYNGKTPLMVIPHG